MTDISNTFPVNFIEIDLSKTTRAGGAGLEAGPTYMVLYHGKFSAGTFYGNDKCLYTSCVAACSLSYEPPGVNYSSFQRIWRMDGVEEIAAAAEPEYREIHKKYAVKNGLTHNGHTITDDFDIAGFSYVSDYSTWPERVLEFYYDENDDGVYYDDAD